VSVQVQDCFTALAIISQAAIKMKLHAATVGYSGIIINMLELFIIFSSISIPILLSLFFVLKYFYLDNPSAIAIIFSIGLVGFLTYSIITVIAFHNCEKRDISSDDKEFWKNVLVRCFYFFSGLPVYYWAVLKKPLHKKEDSYKSLEQLKGDIIYYVFLFEVYGFFVLLSLSAIIAGFSLIFVPLIDIPIALFKLAIFMIIPFPVISYIFYLIMLDEFVKKSRNVDDLKYYFGQKRWLFGVVKYYKKSRRNKNRTTGTTKTNK